MNVTRSLFDINRRISNKIEAKGLLETGVHVEYLRIAALLFACPDCKNVLDVAAGSKWNFPPEYKNAFSLNLSGTDIDGEALARNAILDRYYVANICDSSFDLRENFDLITCYSGVEHFPNTSQFITNSFQLLREGGALVAQFPSRNAPFAIINRVLNQNFKRRLLNFVMRDNLDEIGYPVKYDHCTYSQFKKLAEDNGFMVEYYMPSYMSSDYFKFFFPLFFVSQVIDYLRLFFLGFDKASYNLFVLRKPGHHTSIKWTWH